jgi:PAS domain S-box-containing protein
MHPGSTQDDDFFTFAPDEGGEPVPAAAALRPWRVLIVDDNEEVHKATEIALRDTMFKGRSLEFLHAYSAQQGSAKLRHEQDIAVVLLDVVMETQDAGLRLARHVREDLSNHIVQIILRTGQPGDAPERGVILAYEINDYKSKNELTGTQLFTSVIAALRAFESLQSGHLQQLELSASLSKIKDLETALDQHALVSITDPHGRIVHANDKFCSISQYGREELIGHDHRMLGSGFHPEAFFQTMWQTVIEGRIWQGEICNRAKGGAEYWSAVTIVPFVKPDGKCYQYISIGTDITESKRSEQALRETEERWKYALDVAGDGVWDVNFETGIVNFSKRWKQMNGYPDDALELRIDGWKRLIHPDDMAEVESKLRAYLTGQTAAYVSRHRNLCNDGSWKWVLDRGMVVKRSESGKPERMVGTHTHIDPPASS